MRLAIKYAAFATLLCGATIILLELTTFVPFLFFLTFIIPSELIFLLLFLVFMFPAIREFRKNYLGNWGYGSAFKQGIVYSFFYSCLIIAAFSIYYFYKPVTIEFQGRVFGLLPTSGRYDGLAFYEFISILSFVLFLRFILTFLTGIVLSSILALFLKTKK